MNQKQKNAIKDVVNYMFDEEMRHFEENCECEAEGNIKKCKCKQNKDHIIRDVMTLKEMVKSK